MRVTHAELTKAGFTGLDPLHELFLLYRPAREDEDETLPEVSALNPRHLAGHSPSSGLRSDIMIHGKYLHSHEVDSLRALEVTDQHLEVEAPLKVRQGASLTSRSAGVLPKGMKLRVVDSRIWRGDGTQRLCVTNAEDQSQILPIGWVSARPGFFSKSPRPHSSCSRSASSRNSPRTLPRPRKLDLPQDRTKLFTPS